MPNSKKLKSKTPIKNSKEKSHGIGISFSSILKYLPIILLLAYTYYPTFLWMWERWFARDSYYGHGFLIPLVTLFWIGKKWKDLVATPKETALWGIPLLVFGTGLHMASYIFRIYFLSAFSFVFILLGIIAVLFGRRIFVKVWFPVLFLFLMIPLPLLIISQTTLRMKFFVTEIAVSILNFIHLPSVREGSYIHTRSAYVLVGDPCSGLRSFLAFICLGFVFAYESRMEIWKKFVIIFAGLPLAILSNVIRVFFLALVAEVYGMHSIEGKVHDISGIIVFIIAFTAFMFLRKKMEENYAKI